MNLDDVIRIARRLWPRGFAVAYVAWFEHANDFRGRYYCIIEADQDICRIGDSESAACSAVVSKLREIEASRGRPS